jgi:ribonuclease-3 family protein
MRKINKQGLNTTALAYLGDAVYEINVRSHVLESGRVQVDKLHQMAVKYVRAEGQAQALKAIYDKLDEDELVLVRRAKNRKVISKPKNVDPVEYKLATAFEALIGYLYLQNKQDRLIEIIDLAFAEIEKEQ